MAWVGLGFALAFNYRQHRRGKMTICALTRAVVPEPVFRALFRLGADLLEGHVANGYPHNRV